MKINDEQRIKIDDALEWLASCNYNEYHTVRVTRDELYSILSIDVGDDSIPFCPLTQQKCREDCAWCHFELGCVVGNVTEVLDILVKRLP